MFNKPWAIVISLAICALAVISFTINWPAQFVITGSLYLLAGNLYAVRGIRSTPPMATFLVLVSPYVLIYSIGAFITGNAITFPIALIGPVAGAAGFLLGRSRKPSVGSYLLLIAGLLLIGSGFYGMKNWITYVRNPASTVNEVPPAVVFRNEIGREMTLAELKGKTIVLDFWSTTCAPCVKKFPVFDAMKQQYSNDPDIVFASVYLPNVTDRDEVVKTFGGHHRFSFLKLYSQDRRVWTDFKVPFVPYLVVIDKDFRIRYRGSFRTDASYTYLNAKTIIENINKR